MLVHDSSDYLLEVNVFYVHNILMNKLWHADMCLHSKPVNYVHGKVIYSKCVNMIGSSMNTHHIIFYVDVIYPSKKVQFRVLHAASLLSFNFCSHVIQ